MTLFFVFFFSFSPERDLQGPMFYQLSEVSAILEGTCLCKVSEVSILNYYQFCMVGNLLDKFFCNIINTSGKNISERSVCLSYCLRAGA